MHELFRDSLSKGHFTSIAQVFDLSPSVTAFDLTYSLRHGYRRDTSPSLSILAREGEE